MSQFPIHVVRRACESKLRDINLSRLDMLDRLGRNVLVETIPSDPFYYVGPVQYTSVPRIIAETADETHIKLLLDYLRAIEQCGETKTVTLTLSDFKPIRDYFNESPLRTPVASEVDLPGRANSEG